MIKIKCFSKDFFKKNFKVIIFKTILLTKYLLSLGYKKTKIKLILYAFLTKIKLHRHDPLL